MTKMNTTRNIHPNKTSSFPFPSRVSVFKSEVEDECNQEAMDTQAEDAKEEVEHTQRVINAYFTLEIFYHVCYTLYRIMVSY